MKKETKQIIIIVLIALLGCFADNLFAQKVTRDSNGNYIATAKPKSKAKLTGNTYTDKNMKVYPVYISENGKLFIRKVSEKSGNEYNYYLKVD